MDDLLGNNALFLTTTPCDACTFRVRLFAEAGKAHTLPPLPDPFEEDCTGDCMIDFEVRRKQRETYPGACSLVYQHLMQIVIECLMGWDPKTKSGTSFFFGKLLAWVRTDEEQGRKTLHGHWQLWVEDFNLITCATSID